ncbi:RagB/SusD family nutrient uptake outer membrane protein [Cyclobacterium sp.]|uniref:RagB/SusD family nutrient uptake outer membrane protein n=1 Tax=Cyclobacterium sp. TaxID=1966343 RepID=UPI0019C9BB78|nr:RagB/SusD family nutrient uptake outer membrane protein [Cyclobacterium sp.]MBD3628786.1 hypothetical protein [Cyclobacterium sp.]
MLRTRKFRSDLTGDCEDFIGTTNVFNGIFAEKNLLFPFPLREMDVNAGLVQNPGY